MAKQNTTEYFIARCVMVSQFTCCQYFLCVSEKHFKKHFNRGTDRGQ